MKIMLRDVRLMYAPGLIEAKKPTTGTGDAKFSTTLAFAPTHPAVAQIKQQLQAAATDKWKDNAGAIFASIKAAGKSCLRDGDGRLDGEGKRRPEYAGQMYVAASSKVPPLLMAGDRNVLAGASAAAVLYSGCYVNASVEIKAYDFKTPEGMTLRGLRAELLGVQFFRDGTRLSSGATASVEDFEAIPEAAGDAQPTSATSAGAGAATAAAVDPFA